MNRSPLVTALFHPINLLMLALTVAAGLCSAWWLAPIGFVLWLVMVVIIARDPGLRMTFSRQSREPLSPRYQNRFDRLDKARISILNAESRFHSAALSKMVEPIQTALEDLVEHAYRLGLRMTAMDNNFAVQQLTSNFDDDIARLEKSINETTDPALRKEFGNTLQSYQNRKSQLNMVSSLLSRFETQLNGTGSAVDSVVTYVVSLQGRDPKQAADKIPAILQTIQTEQDELKQFDEEVEKTALI